MGFELGILEQLQLLQHTQQQPAVLSEHRNADHGLLSAPLLHRQSEPDPPAPARQQRQIGAVLQSGPVDADAVQRKRGNRIGGGRTGRPDAFAGDRSASDAGPDRGRRTGAGAGRYGSFERLEAVLR